MAVSKTGEKNTIRPVRKSILDFSTHKSIHLPKLQSLSNERRSRQLSIPIEKMPFRATHSKFKDSQPETKVLNPNIRKL